MQATAEAVAKLQLQARAAADVPGPATAAANLSEQASGLDDAHVLQQQSSGNGNGVLPSGEPKLAALPDQVLGLQPADSGYLADTEGQPVRGPVPSLDAPMKQANGIRTRPASRRLAQVPS